MTGTPSILRRVRLNDRLRDLQSLRPARAAQRHDETYRVRVHGLEYSEGEMSTFPVPIAAPRLKIDASSLRRWIQRGCPVVRKGRRGPGGAALVDLDKVNAWRGRVNGAAGLSADDVLHRIGTALLEAVEQDHVDIRAGFTKEEAAAAFVVAFERCCKTFGHTFRFDDKPEPIRALMRVL